MVAALQGRCGRSHGVTQVGHGVRHGGGGALQVSGGGAFYSGRRTFDDEFYIDHNIQ